VVPVVLDAMVAVIVELLRWGPSEDSGRYGLGGTIDGSNSANHLGCTKPGK